MNTNLNDNSSTAMEGINDEEDIEENLVDKEDITNEDESEPIIDTIPDEYIPSNKQKMNNVFGLKSSKPRQIKTLPVFWTYAASKSDLKKTYNILRYRV